MKKKYIMPSIVVEEAMLNVLMETVSVDGEINDGNQNDFTVNAKGNVWYDDEEE